MDGDAAAPPVRVSLGDDVRAVAWWVLIGAGAGGIAGFLIGGIGGRLAMLLLRLTSPESVIGVVSDDGFVIGRLTTDTVGLAFGMALLGGVAGLLYASVRTAIPGRLRLPLAMVFAGLVGGSGVVHDDGVDFTLLEPAALAIALFVALPALAAGLIVLLVERWTPAPPWADRRLRVIVVLGALVSSFALAIAAILIMVALVVRRVPILAGALQRVGPILVPGAIAGLGLIAGIDLVHESRRILD